METRSKRKLRIDCSSSSFSPSSFSPPSSSFSPPSSSSSSFSPPSSCSPTGLKKKEPVSLLEKFRKPGIGFCESSVKRKSSGKELKLKTRNKNKNKKRADNKNHVDFLDILFPDSYFDQYKDIDDIDDDDDDEDESYSGSGSGSESESEIVENEIKENNFEKFSKRLNKIADKNEQERYFIKKRDIDSQKKLLDTLKNVLKTSGQNESCPYAIQVLESTAIPEKYKFSLLQKIQTMENMEHERNGEYFKLKQYIDLFMKLPFQKYSPSFSFSSSSLATPSTFLKQAQQTLDKAVYGMDDAKKQFMYLLAQWMGKGGEERKGTAIGLYGPPGIGKTSLVKDGIAKVLGRPFAFIPLGGSNDVSFFTGHSYTFEGSIPGRISSVLMETQIMDPVFYFDELDKIPNDEAHASQVISMLMHLIDSSQNDCFQDKYFSGVDLDLSRAMFIFSYNDDSKVNPILRDRMYRIECHGYTRSEKLKIATDFLIPELVSSVSSSTNQLRIRFSPEVILYIIDNYTENEQGVRNLKRCLETIVKQVNLDKLLSETKMEIEEQDSEEGKEVVITRDNVIKRYLKLKTSNQFLNIYA